MFAIFKCIDRALARERVQGNVLARDRESKMEASFNVYGLQRLHVLSHDLPSGWHIDKLAEYKTLINVLWTLPCFNWAKLLFFHHIIDSPLYFSHNCCCYLFSLSQCKFLKINKCNEKSIWVALPFLLFTKSIKFKCCWIKTELEWENWHSLKLLKSLTFHRWPFGLLKFLFLIAFIRTHAFVQPNAQVLQKKK